MLNVDIVEGDISTAATAAIVNAANNHFWMGAGVAGAIKRRGGDEIEREAMAQGPVTPGECVITSGGRLSARHVIHAAVMGQDLQTTADAVSRATRRTLEVADDLGARSLAMPAFGTGVGGFPLERCAELMVTATRSYQADNLERVVFAVFGHEAEEAFKHAVGD
jgi:O-acetyl-ADP-ribose deacetylase